MFFSQVNLPISIPTPAGDQYLEVFQEEITKEGRKALVFIGKTNVYDKIQEGREDTEIVNIMKHLALGDLSVLRQQKPQYIDSTTLPKTLMEANNIVIKAKQEFEKMPKEVKEKFDNDAELYINTMGSQEWLDKMSPYNNQIKEIKEAGSKKEYEKRVAAQAKFEKDVAAVKGGEA